MKSQVFTTVTICGSMRYFDRMVKAAQFLTANGHIVLMPFVCIPPGEQPTSEVKAMLDRMHQAKIDMSDGIYVVGEHRGTSTLAEIEYARSHQKIVVDWIDEAGVQQ